MPQPLGGACIVFLHRSVMFLGYLWYTYFHPDLSVEHCGTKMYSLGLGFRRSDVKFPVGSIIELDAVCQETLRHLVLEGIGFVLLFLSDASWIHV